MCVGGGDIRRKEGGYRKIAVAEQNVKRILRHIICLGKRPVRVHASGFVNSCRHVLLPSPTPMLYIPVLLSPIHPYVIHSLSVVGSDARVRVALHSRLFVQRK